MSAKTLEEAYLLLVAATSEQGWGVIQEELGEDAGLRSNHIHCRE